MSAETVLGRYDWSAALARIWMAEAMPRRRRRLPTLRLRWSRRAHFFCPGLYRRDRHRIEIDVGADARLCDLYSTLIHEAVHAVGHAWLGHGRRFRELQGALAREMTGVCPCDAKVDQVTFDDSLTELMDRADIVLPVPLRESTSSAVEEIRPFVGDGTWRPTVSGVYAPDGRLLWAAPCPPGRMRR